MKIKNLNKEITDLENKPLGEIMISVKQMIKQIKLGKDPVKIIEQLEKLSEDQKNITHLQIYRSALFANLDSSKEPNKFAEALFLAERLNKKEENFLISELEIINNGIPKVNEDPIAKAKAIVNLNYDKLSKEDKKK